MTRSTVRSMCGAAAARHSRALVPAPAGSLVLTRAPLRHRPQANACRCGDIIDKTNQGLTFRAQHCGVHHLPPTQKRPWRPPRAARPLSACQSYATSPPPPFAQRCHPLSGENLAVRLSIGARPLLHAQAQHVARPHARRRTPPPPHTCRMPRALSRLVSSTRCALSQPTSQECPSSWR